ncbi:hypothetical protein [Clostridium sp.]|uniref:hypothetical protein n=1 Tax=Clostridium sp. TaxID=1506 RepID=UPI001A46749D|nr:hypothetical protein [Clostridium sp.]MBK5237159.1 hypothetical protein [Clostridium sp.]
MGIIIFMVMLVNIFFCGAVGFGLMKFLFGNKALGRALAVIASIVSGGLYINLLSNTYEHDMWETAGLFSWVVYVGPIALLLILMFLGYVFGKKDVQ